VTLLSAALGAFLLPVAAQTSSTPAASASASTTPTSTGPENANQINQQKTQEQRRIADGLANGSLTTSEADALEKKQRGVK
jgi:hypothetical protein